MRKKLFGSNSKSEPVSLPETTTTSDATSSSNNNNQGPSTTVVKQSSVKRRGSIVDLDVLMTGRELENIKEAEKKGMPLTSDQRKVLVDNSFTLNRKILDAYKYLCKIRSLEAWICKSLKVEPPPDHLEQSSKAANVNADLDTKRRSASLSKATPQYKEKLFSQLHSILSPTPASAESISDHHESEIAEAFHNWIKDGVLLCQLLNTINPGIVKTINLLPNENSSSSNNNNNKIPLRTSSQLNRLQSFKARENILFFLDGCKKMGINRKGEDLFAPPDLFESKNLVKVVDSLILLAKTASEQMRFKPRYVDLRMEELSFSQEEVNNVAYQLEESERQSSAAQQFEKIFVTPVSSGSGNGNVTATATSGSKSSSINPSSTLKSSTSNEKPVKKSDTLTSTITSTPILPPTTKNDVKPNSQNSTTTKTTTTKLLKPDSPKDEDLDLTIEAPDSGSHGNKSNHSNTTDKRLSTIIKESNGRLSTSLSFDEERRQKEFNERNFFVGDDDRINDIENFLLDLDKKSNVVTDTTKNNQVTTNQSKNYSKLKVKPMKESLSGSGGNVGDNGDQSKSGRSQLVSSEAADDELDLLTKQINEAKKLSHSSSNPSTPIVKGESGDMVPQTAQEKKQNRRSKAMTMGRSSKETNFASMKFQSHRKRKWNADQILPGLFLGGVESANDLNQLLYHNITHIVCLIGGQPVFPNEFKYLIVDAYDTGEHDIISYFPKMNTFIDEGVKNGAVLVHCQKGVSRSSSVVVAYLMYHHGYNFYDAADLVCEKRPIVCPNLGFIKQLQLYEQMAFNVEGVSEIHQQFRKLRLKSQAIDYRLKWSTDASTIQLPYLGDEIDQINLDPKLNCNYACTKCSTSLFTSQHVIEHDKGEGTSNAGSSKDLQCNYMYILPLKWMGKINEAQGEIKCHSCQNVVGKWNWSGVNCSCGFNMKPSFVIQPSSVKKKQ